MNESENTGAAKRRTTVKNIVPGALSHQLGKLPPQAVDIEEAVLGALMLEKDALSAVIDVLRPEVFYKEAHQKIFNAIHHLFHRAEL